MKTAVELVHELADEVASDLDKMLLEHSSISDRRFPAGIVVIALDSYQWGDLDQVSRNPSVL